MYNFCTFTIVMKNMKDLKSKRTEFTESQIKQLDKAAKIKGQSTKKFIEMAAIALAIQTINQ